MNLISGFTVYTSTHCYASRRSRTREYGKAVSVCLCVCSSCNCSTVAMQRKLTASIGFYSHVLLGFDSWICKLKLCSRVMATLTYSEGCCCLFRIFCSIICPHKLSIQPILALHQSACYLLATRVKKEH